ncbi:MAG: FumA C-terminus/TtdB family hydratase beta subunit [Candidatus Micrarchaeota archaeon]
MEELKTPLESDAMRSLNCGQVVYITGKIFTARDAAHREILKTRKLPFKFKESNVLFHAGPIMKKQNGKWKAISLGPTTSSRMDAYTPKLIHRLGIRAIIGKGGMDGETVKAMKGKCVYLAFTGGCAAVGAASVKNVVGFHWPEMGMAEGVWELEVERFGPLIVAIDSKGRSLYKK